MTYDLGDSAQSSAGAWAKRYYYTSRAAMESTLRSYDLGSTQWYVLYQLASRGPTRQRDLVRTLDVERATLSTVVATLVRKGLIEQAPDATDHRQRVLRLTPSGDGVWERLPDPVQLILATAFEGVDDADLDTVVRVLQAATKRLEDHSKGATGTPRSW